MSSYRLNIKFNEKDLKTIYMANEKVVVIKHTAGAESSQVVWVSFRPFMFNTIDWENNFAVYSSSSEIQGGAVINKLSDKEAATKIRYDFEDGYFRNAVPANDLGNNTYAIRNQMTGYDALTFGLAQSVVVNGIAFANHPINAVSVPFGQSADMTPIEKIDIYLRGDINDGTIVSHVMSVSLPVEYEGMDTEHTVAYDGLIGKFYPVK
ncbi:MAG: hypothetical protein LBV33_00170 [Lachnospiraceae bacterium]|nr:hypothetical protein [Lachnospiraceae bacterium]